MVDLVAQELEAFGADGISQTAGGVAFEGTLEVAYRACLWSRIANRILLTLGSFPAETPEALYAGVREINWAEHLDTSRTIAVDCNVSRSTITHSHYASLKIKDAVVDWFQEREGVRPSVNVDSPDVRLNAYIYRDVATLYLDLSGRSLHQRGYRLGQGEAPLKENLAAALLLRAGWPKAGAAGGALVDPMCGSGTLLIEGVMMIADIAPQVTHDFGFLTWKQHHADIWQRLLAEASYRREQGSGRIPPALGFDSDRRVLEHARANAERAGVAEFVQFAYQDIASFRQDLPGQGLAITNPPYGKRLGETDELPSLYRALGSVFKREMKGWHVAVFTQDQEMGKHIPLTARKINTLYNGAIECKLIQFDVEERFYFKSHRLPARLDTANLSEQAEMFRNRLAKNHKQLQRWANREGVACYRIYDADLPDYSAAIDVYGGENQQWVCMQEYEAPASVDQDRARQRAKEIRTVVQEFFELDEDNLFYKTRARQRGEHQYEKQDGADNFHQVNEGDCKFWVNFQDYLDTGLFLDHRPLRQRIASESRDQRFLNLFGYTGTASVHAAVGGASQTVTVDMSKTYLDWAARNLALNGVATEENRLVQADCMAWLGERRRQRFDVILLDPPSFSNSKRMKRELDVQRDHPELIEKSVKLLEPGGTLYFSTNLRTFRLDASVKSSFDVQDITGSTIPFDFKRRKNIHQCFEIRPRS